MRRRARGRSSRSARSWPPSRTPLASLGAGGERLLGENPSQVVTFVRRRLAGVSSAPRGPGYHGDGGVVGVGAARLRLHHDERLVTAV
jgi:hypothetical protein